MNDAPPRTQGVAHSNLIGSAHKALRRPAVKPAARVRTATAVKPGFIGSLRALKCTSCQDVSKVEKAAILREASAKFRLCGFYCGCALRGR
jgi:hypothetical protein